MAERSFSRVWNADVEAVGKVGRLPADPRANISSSDPVALPPDCLKGELPAD